MNKKILSILLYSVIIILLLTIMILIMNKKTSLSGSFISMDKNNLKEENLVKSEKTNLMNISNIKINTTNSEIIVKIVDEEKLEIKQYGKKIKEKEQFKVTNNNNELIIEDMIGKGLNFTLFLIAPRSTVIVIYLPRMYVDNLEIKSVSSDIYLEETLEINNLKLSTTSGNININTNITLNKLEASSVSGDIEVKDVNSETTTIKTTSGSIDVDNIVTNELTAKTVSGDLNVENIKGIVNIKTTSGEIKLNKFEIKGNSELNTVSGDVVISVIKDQKILIISKTVSGEIKTFDGSNSTGTEPYKKITIKTTSGDINVR